MKKKILIIIIILITITTIITALILFNSKRQKELNNKKYEEILNALEEALIWEMDATDISDKRNCGSPISGSLTSEYLISQGYLKREDMKDVDNKSYCNGLAKIRRKDGCKVKYKLYISCKDYETKKEGYVD